MTRRHGDKRPRVFVVQDQHRVDVDGRARPKFDLTPARVHGDVVFLLSPTAQPTSAKSVVHDLHKRLRDYDGEADFLLLVGNPCLIGWTVAIAAHYAGGRVKLLQWDARERDYRVVDTDVLLLSLAAN